MKYTIAIIILCVLVFMVGCDFKPQKSSETKPPATPSKHTGQHAKVLNLVGDNLIDSSGKSVSAEKISAKKYLVLYFSAHWCPPCRAFTPKLVKFYNENHANYEVLFVSSDHSLKDMLHYMHDVKMPWLGLKYGSAPVEKVKKLYAGPGIPCLVLVDAGGKVLSHSFKDGKYLGPDKVLGDLQKIVAGK